MDPNDPRAIRSRQALTDVFIDLALEQGYPNLTVRELTKKAGVGYATFFRQFKSLDDLLFYILQAAFQELLERVSLQQTLYDEAVAIYIFVRDYSSLLRLYLTLPLTNPVRQIFIAETETLILSRCQQRATSTTPIELSVEHILETSNRLIAWYLDRLTEYTPEQIASIHYDLVIAGTQAVVSMVRHDHHLAPTTP